MCIVLKFCFDCNMAKQRASEAAYNLALHIVSFDYWNYGSRRVSMWGMGEVNEKVHFDK